MNLECEGSQANNHGSSQEERLQGGLSTKYSRHYPVSTLAQGQISHLNNYSLVKEGDQNTHGIRLDRI